MYNYIISFLLCFVGDLNMKKFKKMLRASVVFLISGFTLIIHPSSPAKATKDNFEPAKVSRKADKEKRKKATAAEKKRKVRKASKEKKRKKGFERKKRKKAFWWCHRATKSARSSGFKCQTFSAFTTLTTRCSFFSSKC